MRCVGQSLDEYNTNEVFTFALQKFEVPFVGDIGILKLRPLWCYNLCIFDEIRKKTFMFVWNESVATFGSQEIGSCLYQHLSKNVSENANKVFFFSDPCFGQTRNIKIAMLLQQFLESSLKSEIETIEQIFTFPGHSRNDCTRIFAHISRIRRSKTIFSPEHWVEVLSSENNEKFVVVEMKREDFFDIARLEDVVKSNENENIFWPNIETITYRSDEPSTIKLKNNDSLSMQSIFPDEFFNLRPDTLHRLCNEISKEKYDDLIESLVYVTDPNYHAFYKSLEISPDHTGNKDYGVASRLTSDDENTSD